MSKALFGFLVALALVAGLAFRLARLDARPMHHDEANQAVKFGALLESGDYRYDASDHHGPTLYYLTLPAAWLRGQRTLAALDETTVRLVPACFGVALILLMLPLVRGFGRPAIAVASALAAVSPALTYYSRFYIQEMSFACFSLGFLITAGRYAERPSFGRAAAAALAAGLAMATKETWLVTLPAAVLACAAAWWQPWRFASHLDRPAGLGQLPPRGTRLQPREAKSRLGPHLAAGLFLALLVACLFYSSFLTNPAGIVEWLRSFPIYGSRGLGDGRHDEPWYFYLHLLAFWKSGGLLFTEALVLALAAVGIVFAFRRRPSGGGRAAEVADLANVAWPRAFALYGLLAGLVFSVIPYKTPWNLVPFHAALVVVAGHGAAGLLALARRRFARVLIVAGLGVGTWHLGVEAWRADVRYAADPRNPYVYAQTTPDFLRLSARIADLAAVHPDGRGTLVKVVAGPYEQWPLPWYLRTLTRVGYWSRAPGAGLLDEAPILVASQENAPAVDAAVGDRYVSQYYGLRPDVLLALYVERGLWDKYLAGRATRTRN